MPPPISLPNLTIPNGQTDSNVLDLTKSWVKHILFLGPAALDGTVTVCVCDAVGGTYVALQSGGADVTLPADKGTVIDTIACKFLMLKSGASETAERVFRLMGREDEGR